jgi:hypothetical protein
MPANWSPKAADARQRLRLLAVFFGGQDHAARILLRLPSR